MAGDWIKMRNDLSEDPAVIEIAARLELDEFAVVGRLQCLWSWADGQSRDGHARGVTAGWINRKVQRDGFAEAMCLVGWLAIYPDGIVFPNFANHNGETAKTRALGKNRKQKERSKPSVTVVDSDVSRNERDKSVTREEKRREEKKEAKASTAVAFAPPDWVPSSDWIAFVKMRKAMRNIPFTEDAAKGVVSELGKLCTLGHNASDLLQSAVMNGWRTVYPPKNGGPGSGAAPNKQEALEQRNRRVAEQWANEGVIDAAT